MIHTLAIKLAVVYDLNLIKFDKNIFCALFNLKARLRGWDIRFSYDPKENLYAATDPKYKKVFFERGLTNYGYNKGFAKRSRELAEAYMLDLVDFKDGDLIVDCGANVGDLLMYFDIKGLKVEYIGFEPSPSEFMCLERNVSPRRAMNLGLWYEEKELKFYVSSGGADSSFIEPPRYDSIANIPTKRLDTIVTDRRIKLLKLEAEGAEPEVIQGCDKILADIEFIAADLGEERGKEQESTMAPVINYVLSRNFEIISINAIRGSVLFRNKASSGGEARPV